MRNNILRKSQNPHKKTSHAHRKVHNELSKSKIHDYTRSNYNEKLTRNSAFQFYRWIDKTLAFPELYEIPKKNTKVACRLISQNLKESDIDFKKPDYRKIADCLLEKLVTRLQVPGSDGRDDYSGEISVNFRKLFDVSNNQTLFSYAYHLSFMDNFFEEIGRDRMSVWLRFGGDFISSISAYLSGSLELFGQRGAAVPLIKAGASLNIPSNDRQRQNEYVSGFKKAGIFPRVIQTHSHLLFLEKILSLKNITDGNPVEKIGHGFIIFKVLPENSQKILQRNKDFMFYLFDPLDDKYLAIRHDNPKYVDNAELSTFKIHHKNTFSLELKLKEELNNFRITNEVTNFIPKGIFENTNLENLKALSKTIFQKYSSLEKEYLLSKDDITIFDYEVKNKLLDNAADLYEDIIKQQKRVQN